MPGPISDSYDPEWSTSSNKEYIEHALKEMHGRLGEIIGGPPKYILDVVLGADGVSVDCAAVSRRPM